MAMEVSKVEVHSSLLVCCTLVLDRFCLGPFSSNGVACTRESSRHNCDKDSVLESPQQAMSIPFPQTKILVSLDVPTFASVREVGECVCNPSESLGDSRTL
jgi:hypothetical protein